MMVRDTASLGDALRTLSGLLLALPPGPAMAGSAQTDTLRRNLSDQIHDYLLPRLTHLEAPLLVGIGGSTGAGKSTITNTLTGEHVTDTGVLRPTTRTPVLVCHPADLAWFMEGGVLPDLPRTTGRPPASGQTLAVRTSSRLRQGLALLDTPDIDSLEIANHELAAQLLGAVDLWLFVTTAARYADAVPWGYLHAARERSITLAIAVNRIPLGAAEAVTTHLGEMLTANGLTGVTVFALPEGELVDGRLPATAAGTLAWWVDDLAADADRRLEVVRTAIDGAVRSIPARAEQIARGVEGQAATVAALAAAADDRHDDAVAQVERRLDAGTMLRSEVLERWQELVGAGRMMQTLQSGVARLRDRLRSLFAGTPSMPAEVHGELRSALGVAITEAADAAADATVAAWEASDAGRELLGDQGRTLARPTPGLAAAAERHIEAWEDFVLALVSNEAAGKRMLARTVSLGINTVGAALMVVLFAHTGGLTGGEVVVAGGTATVSQALLTAIFGESAVRELARQARNDLVARVQLLLAGEAERFHRLLDGLPTARHAEALRLAAGDVAAAAR